MASNNNHHQQDIVLFDLASRDGNKCWSYNPWKTRFVLAHKQLPYTTEFLDYPDIRPRLRPHLPASTEDYTIPTIQYTDGRYIIDSRTIAETLERDHPSPSLHLDSPALAKLEQHLFGPVVRALRPHYVPKVPRSLLREASLAYFVRTREAALGMTLDEFERSQTDFSEATPLLHEVTSLLTEQTDGPYFLGSTVSYADFVWGGLLLFVGRIDPTGKELEGLLQATGDARAHQALLDALAPLSQRDDH